MDAQIQRTINRDFHLVMRIQVSEAEFDSAALYGSLFFLQLSVYLWPVRQVATGCAELTGRITVPE